MSHHICLPVDVSLLVTRVQSKVQHSDTVVYSKDATALASVEHIIEVNNSLVLLIQQVWGGVIVMYSHHSWGTLFWTLKSRAGISKPEHTSETAGGFVKMLNMVRSHPVLEFRGGAQESAFPETTQMMLRPPIWE